jgi:RNA polymerase sigma-70 factor (ECF subfamily)
MAAEGVPGTRERNRFPSAALGPVSRFKKGGSVPANIGAVNQALEKYRAYLETLTYIQVDPRLRGKFGLSDIIQNTLLEASGTPERIAAMDSVAQKRWLRRMLLHNLKDEIDRYLTKGRNVGRERSLDGAAEESSRRVCGVLAAEESTPSEKLIKKEEALRVLEALSQLPEGERESLVLQQYHGWKLAQIAEHLGCTMNAVAGLQRRGRARLRKLLSDLE